MPTLGIFGLVENPAKPRSTTNVVIRSSSLAYTQKMPASGPFVMNVLRPSMT